LSGALSPNQSLDGMQWYQIGSTEYQVVAHNGRLYDFSAVAELTNSSGKLTNGTDANAAWVDGKVYWGDGVKHNVRHNGTRVDQAMVDTPASAPSVANGGGSGPTGTYTYKITFMSADGNHSNPSSASGSITVSNDSIDLSSIPTCTAGQDCSGRGIWRNKNGGSVYYLVATIADNVTTTYNDTTTDANLGAEFPQRLGASGGEKDLTRLPPCRLLIAHQNRLIGALSTHADGDRQTVYISNYREPWYCPVFPDLDDPNDGTRIALQEPGAGQITGLCSHGDKVAVFTGNAAYLLTTSDQLLDFTLYRFASHGCVAHRTIKSVKDMLIWLAPDGVYMAREGQGVQRISDDEFNTIAAKDAAVMAQAHAVVYNDRYYLFWPDGCLVYHLKHGIWTRNTNWLWRVSTVTVFNGTAERIFAAPVGEAVDYHIDRVGFPTDNGQLIETRWKSKAFDCGLPYREKRLHYVDVKWKTSSGDATVKLYRETRSDPIQTVTVDLADNDED
jgi:hypothetical protein